MALPKALRNRPPRRNNSEVQRVAALPSPSPPYQERLDLTPLLRTEGGTWTLHPLQNAALHAIAEHRGAFLPIGVGQGKTLIGLLAGTVLDAGRVLYLCPAALRDQMADKIAEYREHWQLPTTINVKGYSELSLAKNATALLPWLQDADLVVCDEAHKLRNHTSTRTSRFLEAATQVDVPWVMMSGTLLSAGSTTAHHLAAVALRDQSPLPRIGSREVDVWAGFLDGGENLHWHERAIFTPLLEMWGPKKGGWVSKIQSAFQARMHEAPGVVMSATSDLGCSLTIQRITDIPLPAVLADAAALADDEYPDGIAVEDDTTPRVLRKSLSLGFWRQYQWEDGEPDYPWLDALRAWNRGVRGELEYRRTEGYDSALLVRQAVERDPRHPLHPVLAAWQREQARRPQAPPQEPVWLDDAPLRAALKGWKGSIWYSSPAVADWLEREGYEVWRPGTTPTAPGATAAFSIRSHGTGVDGLQYIYSRMLVLEDPEGAVAWEQLLGRLHRQGQTSDVVVCYVVAHTEALVKALENAKKKAAVEEKVTGAAQKLLTADWC